MRSPFRRSERPPALREGGREVSDAFDDAFQQKLESLVLLARRIASGSARAERRAKKSGSGIEFAEHRPYVVGDDFRFLDWKAFGRSGRLVLKQFEEEQDISVYLLLDCSASMNANQSEKLKYGKKITAALGYIALAGLDRVSVQAFGESLGARLAPTRGQSRALTLLRFVARLSGDGKTDMARALRTFAARESRRGIAIVITDGYDAAGFESGIDALRYARFDTTVLHIVDPAEISPKLLGDLTLVDAETGDTREVTITEAMLQRLQEAHALHAARLSGFCRDKKVPYFELSIARPFDEAVLDVLRRGGLLG
jgi:uncharacterized protein (DUF58 family)